MFAPTGSATSSARAASSSAFCSSPRIAATSENAVSAAAAACGSANSSARRLASSAAVNRHVPVADAGGHARVEHQQPRQVPEPSLRPQSVDRRRQEVVAQVERADDERGRPEEASRVGVEPLVTRRALQAREDPGGVTQRIRIGVDRERRAGLRHSHRPGDATASISACLTSGPGSTHQAREATSQSRSTCRSWSPAAPACSAAAMSDVVPLGVERARQGRLLDPCDPRAVQLAEIQLADLAAAADHEIRPPELHGQPGGARAGGGCGSPVRRARRRVSSR